MALSTMQERGSVVGVSLPFRPWLAVPGGDMLFDSRISIAYYCTNIARGSWCLSTQGAYVPGATQQDVYTMGSFESGISHSGSVAQDAC